MKRYLIPILVPVLVVAITFTSGCASTGSHSTDEVVSSFYNIAKQRTVEENKMLLYAWSPPIMLAVVKYIKDEDYYEIDLPCEPDNPSSTCVEEWGIDMQSTRIWPINYNAIMWALVLFCHSKDDPNSDCQLWVHELDALKNALEN